MMNKNLKELYWKARSEYYSPYNDGWTQQYYKEIMNNIESKYGNIDLDDSYDSDYTITLPDNVIKSLGVSPGDKLVWSVMSDGSCVLRKFDSDNVTEVSCG